MKIYSATTTAPLELSSIFGEGTHVFPVGSQVSAMAWTSRANGWHLNAEHGGETYDGYADGASLTIGAVIGTVNE